MNKSRKGTFVLSNRESIPFVSLPKGNHNEHNNNSKMSIKNMYKL